MTSETGKARTMSRREEWAEVALVRWTRKYWLPTLMVITVAALLAAALVKGDVGIRLTLIWVVMIGMTVLAMAFLFRLALRVVGEQDDSRPGYRAVAVALALLVGSVFGGQAASDAIRAAEAVGGALFVETPVVVGEVSVVDGLTDNARLGLAMGELYRCMTTGKCQVLVLTDDDTPGSHRTAWLVFLASAATVLMLARALSESRKAMQDSLCAELKGEPSDDEQLARSLTIMRYPKWVAVCIYAAILVPATYFSVGALLLLNLENAEVDISAVRDALNKAEVEALSATPKVDVNFSGLDAKLRTIQPRAPVTPPPPSPEDAAADETEPGIQRGASQSNRTLGSIEAIEANKQGREWKADFERWRANYEFEAIQSLAKARRNLTPKQLSDQVAMISAHYQGAITSVGAGIRLCHQALADLDARTSADGANAGSEDLFSPAIESCHESQVEFPTPLNACNGDCQPHAAKGPDDKETPGKSATLVEVSQGQFLVRTYRWIGDAKPAILIMGLIGFGLFGAAIRMMGRPDAAPYSLDDIEEAESQAATARKRADDVLRPLPEAQKDAKALMLVEQKARERVRAATRAVAEKEAALTELKTAANPDARAIARADAGLKAARARNAAAEAALRTATDSAAAAQRRVQDIMNQFAPLDEKAKIAESIYHQRHSAMLEDRNNIVVERRRPIPGEPGRQITEYVVTGAPAKVLVQGLGAAFTVFLAGQSGVILLTGGNSAPSASGLLLACFVGAVFAEEIWKGARRILTERVAPAPAAPPKPKPAPTPPATQ